MKIRRATHPTAMFSLPHRSPSTTTPRTEYPLHHPLSSTRTSRRLSIMAPEPSPDQLPDHGDVVDIGGSSLSIEVAQKLERALTANFGPMAIPSFPDELLYDDVGLQIWGELIFTKDFYQTHDEIRLLDKHGRELVDRLEDGVVIIDLGAG